MIKSEFQKVLESVFSSMRNLTQTKGEEYAGSEDQFANFKRSAEQAGITKHQVWLVFFNKHMDSIKYFVKNGKLESTESIQSRIDDAILYLILLRGMIEEDTHTEAPAKKPDPVAPKAPMAPGNYDFVATMNDD